ncbi:hypothetical protein CDAR_671 [Caerostris darwini]|uniref:Uncharacterized protein n=1 Tax=Caerostris darwini TaxID=1538125 RepID=A0AAV4UCA1_9ARAC|nr:hypothetical protein CDAR_671 [Caerostris darwini]
MAPIGGTAAETRLRAATGNQPSIGATLLGDSERGRGVAVPEIRPRKICLRGPSRDDKSKGPPSLQRDLIAKCWGAPAMRARYRLSPKPSGEVKTGYR